MFRTCVITDQCVSNWQAPTPSEVVIEVITFLNFDAERKWSLPVERESLQWQGPLSLYFYYVSFPIFCRRPLSWWNTFIYIFDSANVSVPQPFYESIKLGKFFAIVKPRPIDLHIHFREERLSHHYNHTYSLSVEIASAHALWSGVYYLAWEEIISLFVIVRLNNEPWQRNWSVECASNGGQPCLHFRILVCWLGRPQ